MINMKSITNEEKWIVLDVESTTYKYYEENGFTKVWLWCIAHSDGSKGEWGTNIDSMMKTIFEKYPSYTIYIHNLKFDGSFILNWLIDNNFKFEEKLTKGNKDMYSTLISDMGQWYAIEVLYNTVKYRFLDSLKLLPFSVRKIAKDFGYESEGMGKINIDYEDYTINDTTVEYCYHDVIIVAKALKEIKSSGMTKMTTASCAYANFKNSSLFFNDYFPYLTKEWLLEWRYAYRGGRSQVNPRYAGHIMYNVNRYDVNSMYPSIMRNKPLPYGKPIQITKMGDFELEVYRLKCAFKLKENHLPCILKKSKRFYEDSYYIESDGVEDLYITNLDYKLLHKHYDVIFESFVDGYGFTTCNWLFKQYVDYWYDVKSNSKGAKKQVAKTMLNSLYGKFGTNPVSKSKIPNKNGVDSKLNFTLSEEKDMGSYYLPMAMFITSWAHVIIDDAICATGIENFVYVDTDSVHTIGYLPNEMIDNKELGKFKLEGIEKISKYIRQKCYIFIEDENNLDTMTICCAGLNQACKDYAIQTYKFDLFTLFDYEFEVCDLKLLPIQVPGGCVLKPTNFKLKRHNRIEDRSVL